MPSFEENLKNFIKKSNPAQQANFGTQQARPPQRPQPVNQMIEAITGMAAQLVFLEEMNANLRQLNQELSQLPDRSAQSAYPNYSQGYLVQPGMPQFQSSWMPPLSSMMATPPDYRASAGLQTVQTAAGQLRVAAPVQMAAAPPYTPPVTRSVNPPPFSEEVLQQAISQSGGYGITWDASKNYYVGKRGQIFNSKITELSIDFVLKHAEEKHPDAFKRNFDTSQAKNFLDKNKDSIVVRWSKNINSVVVNYLDNNGQMQTKPIQTVKELDNFIALHKEQQLAPQQAQPGSNDSFPAAQPPQSVLPASGQPAQNVQQPQTGQAKPFNPFDEAFSPEQQEVRNGGLAVEDRTSVDTSRSNPFVANSAAAATGGNPFPQRAATNQQPLAPVELNAAKMQLLKTPAIGKENLHIYGISESTANNGTYDVEYSDGSRSNLKRSEVENLSNAWKQAASQPNQHHSTDAGHAALNAPRTPTMISAFKTQSASSAQQAANVQQAQEPQQPSGGNKAPGHKH